jgi:hypothetical protein
MRNFGYYIARKFLASTSLLRLLAQQGFGLYGGQRTKRERGDKR